MDTNQDRKILAVQTYTIKLESYDDGTTGMTRRNDGFSSFELLGLMEFINQELREQIMGRMTPDSVKREVVKP